MKVKRITEAVKIFGSIIKYKINKNQKSSAINKLGYLEDMEEQGKMLLLPCNIGDMIWDNDFGRPRSYKVIGFSFGDTYEEYGNSKEVRVYYRNENGSIKGDFLASEIGENVFLTKEEVEKNWRKL